MNNQLKVGLFLFFGLLIVGVSIFTLGSGKSMFQKTVTVYSYFDSVQGLNSGGIVSLAGVKVGNIESLTFDESKNLVKIAFIINEEFIPKIKSDSTVEIRTQGALGDKYLYITPGTQGTAIANDFKMKSDYGNDLLSVISKRSSDAEKIFDAIAELRIFMKNLNEGNRVASVLRKMDNTADNLQSVSAELKEATANNQVKKSMAHLDSILAKVDNGEGTLGALINDRSLHNRIKQMLGAGEKQKQLKSTLKSSVEE